MVERESLMLKPNQNNICPSLGRAFDTERGDEWSSREQAEIQNWPCEQLKT